MNPQMMRKLATALAVVSTVAAFMFAIMFIQRGKGAGGEKGTKPTETMVVVVTEPVRTMERLSSSNGKFKLVKVPAEKASEEMLTKLESLDGMYAGAAMTAGQPVLKKDIRTPGQLGGLTPAIPIGMVAFTMSVDRFTAVNGFVKANDRVDVVSTTDRGSGDLVARVILQNVLVLAVNAQGPESKVEATPAAQTTAAEPPSSVTLAVTREQAMRLMAAEGKGSKMRLVLRGLGDNTASSSGPVTTGQVYGIPGPPAGTGGAGSGGGSRPRTGTSPRPPTQYAGPAAPRVVEPYSPAPMIYRNPNPGSPPMRAPDRTIKITLGDQQKTVTFPNDENR